MPMFLCVYFIWILRDSLCVAIAWPLNREAWIFCVPCQYNLPFLSVNYVLKHIGNMHRLCEIRFSDHRSESHFHHKNAICPLNFTNYFNEAFKKELLVK